MKRCLLSGIVLVLVGLLTSSVEGQGKKRMRKPRPKAPTADYVHVVIFTVKKGAPKEAVEEAIVDCHKMLAKIDSVRTLKVGRPARDASPKFAKKNYDFALLIVVDDFAGLKAYLDHPSHVAFVKKHGPNLDMEKLQVFDFANQKQ
jgi:hypothetical protein